MIHLVEYVGEAAVYEHLAEEAAELAHAALKYARWLRGENPLKANTNENVLAYNVKEEATDVLVLLEEVGLENGDDAIYGEKVKRMMGRLVDAHKTRNRDTQVFSPVLEAQTQPGCYVGNLNPNVKRV